jgi:diadenosine tetraphosphate (Ap4A) HIT family hydrolase
LAYAIYDQSPVTPLYALVIPKRHVVDCFGLTVPEVFACYALVGQLRSHIQAQDDMIAGFNIGLNAGTAAGQTIFHCHLPVIPRRLGDVENPRGGVRNLIPGKGDY